MRFRAVQTDAKFIALQDELVEFGKDDLPTPGPGLTQLIDLLAQDKLLDRDDFPDQVLRAYELRDEG